MNPEKEIISESN